MTTREQPAPVRLEIERGVAIVTLDRPAVLNAVDVALATALGEALERAEAREGVRALLVRGAGRSFCAGGDLGPFDGTAPFSAVAGSTMARFHPAVLALASSRLPTVAAVHGVVAGAGIGIMLACDFSVAAESTRFTLAYPKIGATIDGGASWFLPRLLGLGAAKRLAMLGDQFGAGEARDLGLVGSLAPDERLGEAAMALAARLAEGPTAAYGPIKTLLAASLERGLAAQLDAEHEAFVGIAESADFAEGLEAFRDRRPPKFEGG